MLVWRLFTFVVSYLTWASLSRTLKIVTHTVAATNQSSPILHRWSLSLYRNQPRSHKAISTLAEGPFSLVDPCEGYPSLSLCISAPVDECLRASHLLLPQVSFPLLS
ncbi:hypothetical protein CsSME_00031657 [Camellia sinensis var. sinensis]